MKKTDLAEYNKIIKIISIIIIISSVIFLFYGYRMGIFRSFETMQEFIQGFGYGGIIVFLFIQMSQVIIPIFPSAVGYLCGVVFWGPWMGFILNYVSIIIGSCVAFALAKIFGQGILHKLFSDKTIQKYEIWTDESKCFRNLFALAILLPIAPDDFLCYLAGTTNMSWKTFLMIILILKPFSLLAYSFGVYTVIPQ